MDQHQSPPETERPRPTPVERKRQWERIQYGCKESLKFLAIEVLHMKDWDTVHDELDKFLKTSGRRKHIELPRGHLKSSFVTKAWGLQQVLKNPDIRILLANAVWDNSRKFLRSIQKYVAPGSTLEMIFGKFVSDHWTQDECTIRQRTKILDAPTWATTGIEKEQTSQHYDLIIADDLVTRDSVNTAEGRQKVKDFHGSLLDLLEPDGTLVTIGTRKHQDDLYGALLEQEGWSNFIRSAYKEDGAPLFPKKFSLEYLSELRRDKGPYFFACEYLNNPIDETVAPFKASMIRYYDGSQLPPLSMFMTVDPAISKKVESDWTALVVCGMDSNRNIFVVDRIRKQMRPSEIVDAIFGLVEKWKLRRIGIENYGYQMSLKYDLQAEMRRNGKFFTIEEMRKPKEVENKRVFTLRLEPFFEQGLIYLRRDMTDFVDEILSFPRGKHDDLLDALAYQLDYLVPASHQSKAHMNPHGSMGWWLKNYLPKPQESIYDRFMADLK